MAHEPYDLEVPTLWVVEMAGDRVQLLQTAFLTCHRKCHLNSLRVCMLILNNRFVRPPPLTPFGIPLGGDDPGGDRQNISGALMTQYLMALLGYQDPAMLGMPENGRMGDYVFNQEGMSQRQGGIMYFIADT